MSSCLEKCIKHLFLLKKYLAEYDFLRSYKISDNFVKQNQSKCPQLKDSKYSIYTLKTFNTRNQEVNHINVLSLQQNTIIQHQHAHNIL